MMRWMVAVMVGVLALAGCGSDAEKDPLVEWYERPFDFEKLGKSTDWAYVWPEVGRYISIAWHNAEAECGDRKNSAGERLWGPDDAVFYEKAKPIIPVLYRASDPETVRYVPDPNQDIGAKIEQDITVRLSWAVMLLRLDALSHIEAKEWDDAEKSITTMLRLSRRGFAEFPSTRDPYAPVRAVWMGHLEAREWFETGTMPDTSRDSLLQLIQELRLFIPDAAMRDAEDAWELFEANLQYEAESEQIRSCGGPDAVNTSTRRAYNRAIGLWWTPEVNDTIDELAQVCQAECVQQLIDMLRYKREMHIKAMAEIDLTIEAITRGSGP